MTWEDRPRVPDGRICGAGGQSETGFGALDRPGPWTTTGLNSSFTVDLYDEAQHGTDSLDTYVTKQGFAPQTQPIGCGDLEPAQKTGCHPCPSHAQRGVRRGLPLLGQLRLLGDHRAAPGAPGRSSVSPARHITGSVPSRHSTSASQAGFAIPRRASAEAVPSPP
ncbi:lytic polysaccharide monooxygenase [Streptomyces sp. EN23]|uniref:lytic polysaccharide monooxygenase n=1 Tax=Streptomyces sp. EN23 TaxID=212774 RepID=UPI00352146C0